MLIPASPLPLTAFEEYMLRDDRPAYPMSIVARMRFAGRLDRKAVTEALAETIARHRLLRSMVASTRAGRPKWIAVDRTPSLEWSDDVVDDRMPAMRPLDLTQEPGIRVWAAAGSQNSTIVLQVHHAACDGKGVQQVADDFLRSYARAVEGRCCTIHLSPCEEELLYGRATFGLTAWKLLKMLPAQLSGLMGAGKFLLRQPVPLLANSTRLTECDKYEFPAVLVGRLQTSELRRLSAAATEQGVTVNDWLLRDFFQAVDAFRRRHEATNENDWMRFSVPINLRQPADAEMPAANIVSMVFLDRNAVQIADPSGLLHGIHEEMDLIRRRQLGLTFIWSLMALRALPRGLARRVDNGRCEATCVVSNLGRALADSPLPTQGGRLVAGNVVLDGIEFFAPVREGTVVTLALVFYAGELQICLQYDARRLTVNRAKDLLASYLQTIRASLADAAPIARDKAA